MIIYLLKFIKKTLFRFSFINIKLWLFNILYIRNKYFRYIFISETSPQITKFLNLKIVLFIIFLLLYNIIV